MNYFQPLKNLFLVVLLSACFTNCSKEDIGTEDNLARMSVRLKHTSQTVNHVFLDIRDVQLKLQEVNGSSNWQSLNAINTGVHNVNNFDADNALLLVDNVDIEAGYAHEIRLVLGDGNFINVNNVLHYLDVSNLGADTPSNLINSQLNPQGHYDLLIDLDIDASVSHNEHENTMVFNPKIYTAIRQIEY